MNQVRALPTPPPWLLAIIRIAVGIGFLNAASNKIGSHWATWPTAMERFLRLKQPGAFAFYATFLNHTVLTHTTLFAGLTAIGESLIGVTLLVGLGTRVSAAVGMFLVTNYLLLQHGSLVLPDSEGAMLYLLLVILVARAGRAWGLDTLVARQWPRWALG